jgi:hypothetical protein
VVDDSDPGVESDLRRRAAWLLLMLAIVAVLLVVVISALVSTHNDSGTDNGGRRPLDNVATQSGAQQSPAGHQSSTHHRQQHQHSRSPGAGNGTGTNSTSIPPATTSCPGTQTCVLQGDPGNSIQAINDFRAAHGLPTVPGSVTPQAQTCALNNGSGCSGGWAETLLSDLNGQEAVQKIEQYAHFEDPQMTSVEVGWAYDPGAKLYYFAIVRND